MSWSYAKRRENERWYGLKCCHGGDNIESLFFLLRTMMDKTFFYLFVNLTLSSVNKYAETFFIMERELCSLWFQVKPGSFVVVSNKKPSLS